VNWLRGLCCAGKLLTGNIGSLCEQQPLKALRAPGGPIPQYKILYYYLLRDVIGHFFVLGFIADRRVGFQNYLGRPRGG
jgi:hypothetical protein